MKFSVQIAGFALLVLAGCAQTPASQKANVVADVRALECAIGYSAIGKMRENSILPDPFMVLDCPFDHNAPIFDLSPELDGAAAATPSGQLLVQRLKDRRFPDLLIADIIKSAPLARAEKLVSKLNQM